MLIFIKCNSEKYRIAPANEEEFLSLKTQIIEVLSDETNSMIFDFNHFGKNVLLPSLLLKQSIIEFGEEEVFTF